MTTNNTQNHADVILVGGGIMSATLGLLIKELQPNLKIIILERLPKVAEESSSAWNNAGTGHSALCELNYTPEDENGNINISKALKIFESFQYSKEFWAYLVQKSIIKNPGSFIKTVPHMSFVRGKENVEFLKKRQAILSKTPGFDTMLFSKNPEEIKKWIPLVMVGRSKKEVVAATYIEKGTDVNFGSLTTQIFDYLKTQKNVKLRLSHEVQDIEREDDKTWKLTVDNLATKKKNRKEFFGKFVFVGAGGGALNILEKSDIEENDGYAGFPVSGQWLRCINPKIIKKHQAKVYGKAEIGAPPMSVPHLDSRMIDGKKELLFGPFAGFTTKFLKEGSLLDLAKSINLSNIVPLVQVGLHNFDLTKYLIEQVIQSPEDRLEALQTYYPKAKLEDWELLVAGQRVQVIKDDPEKGGVLEFGTEMVSSADGSIAALLGASPGASTSVYILLKVLKKCYPAEYESPKWKNKLKKMIPTINQNIIENFNKFEKINQKTNAILEL
ncbi:malate dehydrogenase (quinone) [Lacihabitans sp. LS3-19]|uniref:malate dehydrogenase (quinone) n=1 Tax=Lacihabitans sp. LS3-19 TaxID=2487335 RepID=UPI0020CF4F67|nr:malate dehydrogenase (quinone) [Lacihabitans sp. LS3-19]MCP9766375.1 malate dehydrogenase (quinone) [Lacihabitans sp. LS3-19]